jgi:NAD+ diphosphatase
MSLRTFLSGGFIDRQSWLRVDARLIEQKLGSEAARFVLTFESGCLIESQSALLLKRADVEGLVTPETLIYLGSSGTHELFAIDLPDASAAPADIPSTTASFRSIFGELSEHDAALLAYAKGMVEWRRRHKFCGVCGAPMQAINGGTLLECKAADCGERSFPRLDPAIIVLTLHADLCLLGRQKSWPEGRFSTLAGFVEPGEALEDAVRREVYEETSVRIDTVRYLGSQPWPFPSSLMIGFHADASSTAIELIDAELAEAGWFSRKDLARGRVSLPPPTSIAYRLIERWFDAGELGPLEALNISSDFRTRR